MKSKAKYKGTINARVYRSDTDTWEDPVELSQFQGKLTEQLKKLLGIREEEE